jgi:hypothetical protein
MVRLVDLVASDGLLGQALARIPAVMTPHVPAPRPSSVDLHAGYAATLGAADWPDIRFTSIDGHKLAAATEQDRVTVTYFDLAMEDGRSRGPAKVFDLLCRFCDNDGVVKAQDYESTATKMQVSRLRAKLQAAFGLATDPFEPFESGGWRARFKTRRPR